MHKRLTFVRRAAGLAPEAFGTRWAEWALRLHADGPDGARARRLVHCVVRPGRSDRPHHGVAMAWYTDDAELAAAEAREQRLLDAEVVDPGSLLRVTVEARTVHGQDDLHAWWRTPGEGRLLLLGMIERRPGLSRTAFRDYWWDEHRPLANRVMPPELQPAIYVHDYALPEQPGPWDGLGEFYDDSVDVARRRTQWAETNDEIVRDERAFLVQDTRHALITDAEVVVAG